MSYAVFITKAHFSSVLCVCVFGVIRILCYCIVPGLLFVIFPICLHPTADSHAVLLSKNAESLDVLCAIGSQLLLIRRDSNLSIVLVTPQPTLRTQLLPQDVLFLYVQFVSFFLSIVCISACQFSFLSPICIHVNQFGFSWVSSLVLHHQSTHFYCFVHKPFIDSAEYIYTIRISDISL